VKYVDNSVGRIAEVTPTKRLGMEVSLGPAQGRRSGSAEKIGAGHRVRVSFTFVGQGQRRSCRAFLEDDQHVMQAGNE
jgi:hypothetical protein